MAIDYEAFVYIFFYTSEALFYENLDLKKMNKERYDYLCNLTLKVGENNHFFKRTMLLKWLNKNKGYYINFKNSIIIEIEGKSKFDKLFTSILINKDTEDTIKVNDIENNFEKSISSLLCNKGESFINAKRKKYINKDEYLKESNEKEKIFLEFLPKYLALQLTRSPLYLYIKYESTLKKIEKDNSLIYSIFLMADMNNLDDCGYEKLFHINLARIKNINGYHLFKSDNRIFDCCEVNTLVLSDFFENNVNFDFFEEKFGDCYCFGKNIEYLQNIYITVLSPHILLMVNCNNDNCLFNELKKKWKVILKNYGINLHIILLLKK